MVDYANVGSEKKKGRKQSFVKATKKGFDFVVSQNSGLTRVRMWMDDWAAVESKKEFDWRGTTLILNMQA